MCIASTTWKACNVILKHSNLKHTRLCGRNFRMMVCYQYEAAVDARLRSPLFVAKLFQPEICSYLREVDDMDEWGVIKREPIPNVVRVVVTVKLRSQQHSYSEWIAYETLQFIEGSTDKQFDCAFRTLQKDNKAANDKWTHKQSALPYNIFGDTSCYIRYTQVEPVFGLESIAEISERIAV